MCAADPTPRLLFSGVPPTALLARADNSAHAASSAVLPSTLRTVT